VFPVKPLPTILAAAVQPADLSFTGESLNQGEFVSPEVPEFEHRSHFPRLSSTWETVVERLGAPFGSTLYVANPESYVNQFLLV